MEYILPDVSPQMIEDDINMKQKIEEILVETGYSESRAAKMDGNDLLK